MGDMLVNKYSSTMEQAYGMKDEHIQKMVLINIYR